METTILKLISNKKVDLLYITVKIMKILQIKPSDTKKFANIVSGETK